MVLEILVIAAIVLAAATVGVVWFKRLRRKDRMLTALLHILESKAPEADVPSAAADFRRSLVQTIRARRTAFDFDQFIQESNIDMETARRAAAEVYRGYYSLSRIDRTINRKERQTLDALAELLHLSIETVRSIEQEEDCVERSLKH